MTPTCDYCGEKSERVTGRVIYPHRPDLYHKIFYRCPGTCDAYVGCHPGTDKALGRLANAELRRAKNEAHAAFDPIWRSRTMKRAEAYRWLRHELGMTAEACHIGMFDVATCRRVVAAVNARPDAQALRQYR